ncbi:MAG: LD-carboxypeptidase [bacterium]|nr:LD-carboxypeptidase [bacterium]
MMQRPKHLQKGDHIRIVAPAKRIEVSHVELAKKKLESSGFKVSISENCLGGHHYFSGTVVERLADLQTAIDDPEIDAILCARGGYGCVQLVDRLNWGKFYQNPKWIIGFSDVTVLHQHLQTKMFASIHGTMPLNFIDHSQEALGTLVKALEGTKYSIEASKSSFNKEGTAEGTLLGGNLAIIASLIGTNDQPDCTDCILFVEEVGEPLYSIDRMFYSLKKAGILGKINGLVVGGMTSMKDSEIPYGKTLEEIVLEHFEERNIPFAFNFPAGHIDDNRALIFGATVSLEVDSSGSTLTFQK